MTTRKEKRSQRLSAALFGDFWRKVTALGLAILLWYFLDAQITEQIDPTLQLREASIAAPLATGDSGILHIRIDSSRYSVGRFESAATGVEIDAVDLTLRGARHLVADYLRDNQGGFTVTPSLSALTDNSFDFDVDEIRAINSRFQGLISSMAPRTVKVRLVLNIERAVILDKEHILVVPPTGSTDFTARLMWDEASYSHPNITLVGPESEVEKVAAQKYVVQFSPKAPAPGGNPKVEGTLKLIDPTGKVRMEPFPVTLQIPLRFEPKEFTFEEVRVRLNGDDALLGRFQPSNPTEAVRIHASKTLEVILSGMDPEALRKWGRDNCVLIATLPPDASLDSVIEPDFVITGFDVGRYLEERDFRVPIRPPIGLKQKQE